MNVENTISPFRPGLFLRCGLVQTIVGSLKIRLPKASPMLAAQKELLSHAAADADPGVRIATAGVLGQRKDAAAVQLSERLLQSDRWPPVRRASLVARTSQCGASNVGAVPAIRAAVSDEDETVRRLALTGLARCEGAGAVDIYASTLQASDAPPALRSQAWHRKLSRS